MPLIFVSKKGPCKVHADLRYIYIDRYSCSITRIFKHNMAVYGDVLKIVLSWTSN